MTHYDETKKILKVIRNLNETHILNKQLIREQENVVDTSSDDTGSDIAVINDVDIKLISGDNLDMTLSESQKTIISNVIDSIRDRVSQMCEFKPGFTIKETQIRLDGIIIDLNLSFVLIAGNEGGLYINADMLKIDEESYQLITKLSQFEETFVSTLEPIIRERNNN
jgi:hypothetical protein